MKKIIACPTAPLKNAKWEPVAKERITTGKPQTTYKLLYTSKSAEFFTGIWQSTKGKWKISYTEDEFCTLISGTVRFTPYKGKPQTFKAPDSFIIPSGFKGTWESVTNVRKFFVIYEKSK